MSTVKRALLAGVLAMAVFVVPALGGQNCFCPFCSDERAPTLVGEFAQASMVLYGSFKNAKGNTDSPEGGTTDFVIEQVLKSHDFIKGKQSITLNKFIPSKNKFVVYCDIYKDVVSPYRGEEILPDSDLMKYLTKGLELKDAPSAKRLRHCFDYLNSADIAVSMDAYREFAKADYSEYSEMAKSLPAKTIAGWLEDEKTPNYRYGLYGSLLGHCGNPQIHGNLLRTMIDQPKVRRGSGVDGLMAGLVMLQPKEGWEHLQKMMADNQCFADKDEAFYTRHAVIRTARFFWTFRPDVVSKEKLIKSAVLAMDQLEVADFAIDDLRLWKAWDQTDAVLAIATRDGHNNPIVKRAVLRYALMSPMPKAKAFVEVQRKANPTLVGDIEENLRADEPAEAPKKAEAKK